MSKYQPLGLDDELPFKKHRGKELWEVLETDIDYVRYLVEELDVQLTDEAFAEYRKRMRK